MTSRKSTIEDIRFAQGEFHALGMVADHTPDLCRQWAKALRGEEDEKKNLK